MCYISHICLGPSMWGIWFSCKRETDRWEKLARVREVERRGEWKQNNSHYPSFLFNNLQSTSSLCDLEHTQLLKVFSFCDLTPSPPDDCGEWKHTMCQSACKWSCTSLKVLVPEPSQKSRTGSTPLPHSRAFDIQRSETMSFVFILHLGCGLLFSEIIIEIDSEFEGEAERSHSVQLVVLGFAFFPSKTIKLSWWN